MTLTIFGFIIAALGLFLLFRGGVMAMLLLVMACSLLGGSAAMILTAVGGSSVPPAQFALLFGICRIILPGSGRLRLARDALRANAFLGLYSLYAILAAIFAPVVFRGAIRVPLMRSTTVTRSLFDTVALAPSPQNITASVYIVGSFFAGLLAFVAMQENGAARRFVKMGVIVAWIHISLGVLAAVLKGTPFDLFVDFMRNANYAQTDQSVEGIVRITGIFTEPSGYVGFGFGWFVFLTECWLRDILPKRTGPAALAMGLVLFCSTSSAAYASLAVYGVIFCLRILFSPRNLGASKGLMIAAALLMLCILISAAAFLFPAMVETIVFIVRNATIEKQHSNSGLQRAFWAKIGIDAFFVSYGVGIGPGSFRSSSFVTAMLGSVGVIGSVALITHFVRAFGPLRASTYCGPREGRRFGEEAMIGVAAAWAAVGVLIPASIVSPTSDPGADFAVFTALALVLRQRGRRAAYAEAGQPLQPGSIEVRQPSLPDHRMLSPEGPPRR